MSSSAPSRRSMTEEPDLELGLIDPSPPTARVNDHVGNGEEAQITVPESRSQAIEGPHETAPSLEGSSSGSEELHPSTCRCNYCVGGCPHRSPARKEEGLCDRCTFVQKWHPTHPWLKRNDSYWQQPESRFLNKYLTPVRYCTSELAELQLAYLHNQLSELEEGLYTSPLDSDFYSKLEGLLSKYGTLPL
jgi:hypothetical protein